MGHTEPSRTRHRVRRLLLLALVLVLPLVAVEAGVRALIMTGRLPVAAAHDQSFERSWLDLQRAGPQDIVLFGDSLTHEGIDPGVLGQELGSTDAPLRVFNLASSGGGFTIDRSLIERLAAEGRAPRIAIIGISPVAMKSDLGWREVSLTPMSRLFTDCEPASGVKDVLDCTLEQLSAAWRWHGRLPQVYAALTGTLPAAGLVRQGLLRPDGFRREAPATDAQLAERVAKVVPDEPLTPAVSEQSGAAFVRLVQAFRDAGVPVVAVTVPYQPPLVDALTARDPTWDADWHAAVRDLGERAGIPILDIGYGDWWQAADAHDGKHLSWRGAEAFTRQLAATPGFRDAIEGAFAAATSPSP